MLEFELNEVQDDGATLRDHLNVIWRSTGKIPRQLEEHETLPSTVAHVWGYFAELHKERQSNGFSEGRITSSVMRDWSAISRVDLELWEVKAIRRIDEVWIDLQAKRKKDG